MKKACMNVNGRVWTMTYVPHEDGSIDIIDFNNEDNDGYMFQANLGTLDSVLESDDGARTVIEVRIDGTPYRVRNQQNVFTYKQPL